MHPWPPLTTVRLVTVQDSLICDLCSGLNVHVYMGHVLCVYTHTYINPASHPTIHACYISTDIYVRICRCSLFTSLVLSICLRI